jgi:hypothetical protein
VEKKWNIREKEALAIVWAIQMCRVYVAGTKFIVQSDHASLKWLMKATKPDRLVRWALELAEYDFEIIPRKGIHNGNADALSRLPLVNESIVNNLSSVVETSEKASYDYLTELSILANTHTFANDTIKKETFIKAQIDDYSMIDIRKECEENNGESIDKQYKIQDGLLYKHCQDGRMILLVPHNMITPILKSYHESSTSAHMAFDRLYALLRQRYWWPTMYANTKAYCKNCQACMKFKKPEQKQNGLLQPIITKRPFEMVGCDIIGPLPVTEEGYKYAFVCSDLYTSWVEAAPLKSLTAEEVSLVFFNEVIARHGCPDSIVTDQGSQFTSRVFTDLCTRFNIDKMEATAYHKQTKAK